MNKSKASKQHHPLTHPPTAEDYYGADYPSDELASDDEHDRGAYAYRARRGSNDEQYNLKDDSDNDSDVEEWVRR